jgi:peptidoglycan/LPS O-acetylase OafA/YrhL
LTPGAVRGASRPAGGAPGPRRGSTYVIGLDVLRLVAASMVMAYHFGFWNWTRGQPLAEALPGWQPNWGNGLYFGWVGVEIFFVISGFVIAFSVAEATRHGFLRSRLLRLAPVSWLSASAVLLIDLTIPGSDLHRLGLTYVETMAFWPLNAIDGVWWTLGIEIDFYLVAFLLIGRRPAWSLERVMTTIGLLSGVFWVAALAGQALLGDGGTTGFLRYLVLKAQGNRELQLLLVQHGCFFALGVLIQCAMVQGLTRGRLLAGLGVLAACLLEIVGQNGIIDRASGTVHTSLIPAAFWLVVMALLIVSCRYNGQLLRLAGARAGWVRFAGILTYPLYLLHDAIGIAVVRILSPWFGLWSVALGICATLICAAIVAAVVEPALRGFIGQRIWPSPTGSVPPLAGSFESSTSLQPGA